MAAPGGKQLGVTAPLSMTVPTEAENKASNALIEELKRLNNYETTADTNKRAVVLQSLEAIAEEFVKQVLRAKNFPESYVASAGAKIFTYGSYRLGVFGPGSDIDTLVVVPKDVSRDKFFELFPGLLNKMAPEGSITNLSAVEDAHVPIIKFEYSGISIDLIFSRLVQMRIPKDQTLLDKNLLRGLDDMELRSVNGTRVTDEILELVPQPAPFKLALRGIKEWAQKRAIYANIVGFPGGVAWAMLVARVCQLYPMATGSTIISKFFRIMEQWQWPQPVLLKPIENGPLPNVRIWNPKLYRKDAYHLMPIITPAYPSMCATHNITMSTMKIIQRELKRAGSITDKIMSGKAAWRDLFVKHTFFTQGYKYYLSIIAASTSKEANKKWSGCVESKVRLLVASLEGHESIALGHPFNKGFSRVHRCATDEEIEKAKSGSLGYQISETATEPNDSEGKVIVNADAENGEKEVSGATNSTMVFTSTFYIGLELREGAKSLDLSQEVDEFKKLCTGWQDYNQELNYLNIIHTRNFDLPDDCFDPGEVKPARPQKKKAMNGTTKKRSATEDPKAAPPKRQNTSLAAAG